MLDSVIRDWLEPSPLHPLRAMSGNMWALHPSLFTRRAKFSLPSTSCGLIQKKGFRVLGLYSFFPFLRSPYLDK
jgi:hypothetical protein